MTDQSLTRKERQELEQLRRENVSLKKQLAQEATERVPTGVEKNEDQAAGAQRRRNRDEDDEEQPRTPRCKREGSSVIRAQPSITIKTTTKTAQAALLHKDTYLAPPKPSKQSSAATTDSTTPLKRKRSERDDINEDLAYLRMSNTPEPTEPRRKKKRMPTAKCNDDVAQLLTFDFQAITEWHDDAPPDKDSYSYMPYEDVKDCRFLIKRIHQTVDIWENNRGTMWEDYLEESASKLQNPVCVTSKTAGNKTKRRYGDKEGQYACFDCVANGRPCFRYTHDGDAGKLELLPLHAEDRMRAIVPGKTEVRYWINDHTDFSAADVLIGGEGDEDYLE